MLSGDDRRKILRKVRRLTRALGPIRELDVASLTLDALEQGEDAPRAGLLRMKQHIRQQRREQLAALQRTIEELDARKLRHRLAGSSAGKRRRSRSVDSERSAVARARAARRAVRVRAAIDDAGGVYLPDRLHVVRITVKKLRYAVEIVGELGGTRVARRVAALRAAQDLLGRMHDLEVLIAMVRQVQGAPAAPNFRLSADLDRLVRRLERECRQIHGTWMAGRRKVLEICEQTIAAAQERRTGTPARTAA
jgi:CHAD domain-containing protein